MQLLLIILLVLRSTSCLADVAAEPWPEKIQNLSISRTVKVLGFKVTACESADQEGSGTGGGVYDVTVQNTKTGAKMRLHEQSVGFAVLSLHRNWPQLEVWSRAGGGSWSRSLYRVVDRKYQWIRIDEFTEFDFNAKDKTHTATMPGENDPLYYVETRLLEHP